jgi:hypothetical protein
MKEQMKQMQRVMNFKPHLAQVEARTVRKKRN